MTDSKNVQGVPASEHDIKHGEGGMKVPDAGKISQGTKPPEVQDKADHAEHPNPKN